MAAEPSYPKLISLAVHELRTPASVISGYLRMLDRDTESPLTDRQRKLVEEASKSCARLVSLIAEMSDVSKLDDGLASMVLQPLDLFPLVEQAAASLVPHEDAEPVRLEVCGRADGAQINGDATRLRATFETIFKTLVRERTGPVVILVDRRIVDDGHGRSAVIVMAESADVQSAYDAARVPFDEKRGGLGLSLPIARRVIDAHGGQLWSPAIGDDRAARGAALVAFPLRG